jgi:hypothetical protein
MAMRLGLKKVRMEWKAERPEEYVRQRPFSREERTASRRVELGAV